MRLQINFKSGCASQIGEAKVENHWNHLAISKQNVPFLQTQQQKTTFKYFYNKCIYSFTSKTSILPRQEKMISRVPLRHFCGFSIIFVLRKNPNISE